MKAAEVDLLRLLAAHDPGNCSVYGVDWYEPTGSDEIRSAYWSFIDSMFKAADAGRKEMRENFLEYLGLQLISFKTWVELEGYPRCRSIVLVF